MKLHHIGCAVSDLNDAAKKFQCMGWKPCGDPMEDTGRNVHIQFFADAAGALVELVAPLGFPTPVDGWLKKNGNSPYHLCYESADLEGDISRLKTEGFLLLERSAPAPAIEGRRVAFLYSSATGLLELVEEASKHEGRNSIS